MYFNMKAVPTEESSEYEAFALSEWNKVKNGVTINGVYFSGWLYWHLNHWKISLDVGSEEKVIGNPWLRDNEWIVAEALEKAEESKKILMIAGLRQSAKTTFSSSYMGRKGTVIKGSQNIIIGGSTPDLANMTSDIDFGLINVTPMFKIPRITRDWKSGEVYLGVKSKEGDNQVYSTFRIRNTKGGLNTEVVAGVRASSALLDEVAKAPFAKVIAALKPAMRGPDGWRAPIIMVCTGGDAEKSQDAETYFFNPDSNDVLDYIDETTGKKTGLFLPGYLRQDFKEKTTLANYLNLPEGSELDMPMRVANKERGIETIKKERALAAKDPDSSKLLKAMMYDPLTVEEVFLSEDNNIFPKDLIIDQKAFLANNGIKAENVELHLDANNNVRHSFTTKKPIENFPMRSDDNKEGCVQIWEFPLDDAPSQLYISAMDPYAQADSKYSDSVGSMYIFKRVYDIVSDKFQNMMVAAYHGRPKDLQKYYETCKLLLKFYGAKTLCENQNINFIQHCIEKNEAHLYLVPQPKFLYDIHPNSTVDRKYGIHMTPEIRTYMNNCIIEYMTQIIKTDEENKQVLGVRKILDPLLLEEMMKYGPDVNTDRLISWGLVLAYAKSLDKIPISSKADNRTEAYNNISKTTKSIFTRMSNPFR